MLYFTKWKVYLILAVSLAGVILAVPNLVPRQVLDQLPGFVPQRQIHLGLDLQGGSYLLLEVDMEAVVAARLENLVDATRTQLREKQIGYTDLRSTPRTVEFRVRDPAQVDQALRIGRDLGTVVGTGPFGGGQSDLVATSGPDGLVTLTLSEQALTDKATRAVEQTIEIIRRRIDETGVNEPTIARQGAQRVLVQLPGVDDPERIKRLLGKTAKMTFHLLHPEAATFRGTRVPPGAMLVEAAESEQRSGMPSRYLLRKRVEVDGAHLVDARAGSNSQSGEWVVNFEFDSTGARRFGEVTKENVGKPFAIVLDDRVISAPVIREPILGGRGQISGNFTVQDANDLSVLLRAGALPAPLTIVEERSVGPGLGADAIRAGLYSVGVGFLLVVAYMVATYGIFGWMANLALVLNMVLLVAVLSLMEATLTLPGIAGILLTLGMAVDANILVNERIREEIRKGKSPFASMDAGFQRAYATIIDSNLTTLLTMVILYLFGSGPVRGFAVSISIGIFTTLFTAVTVARLFMVAWLRRHRDAATLPI